MRNLGSKGIEAQDLPVVKGGVWVIASALVLINYGGGCALRLDRHIDAGYLVCVGFCVLL